MGGNICPKTLAHRFGLARIVKGKVIALNIVGIVGNTSLIALAIRLVFVTDVARQKVACQTTSGTCGSTRV